MFSLSHRPGPDRVNTRSDDVARVTRSGSGREPRSVRLQKLSNIDNRFMFYDQILQNVSQDKYTGVIITSDFQHNTHNISSDANRSLGFLRRNLQVLSIKIKKLKPTLTLSDPILRTTGLFGIPMQRYK